MVLSAARSLLSLGALVAMSVSAVTLSQAAELVHDSEYYILEAQNAEQWAVDDKAVDAKLAAFKTKNGGKPPNILYILIDDIGFGDHDQVEGLVVDEGVSFAHTFDDALADGNAPDEDAGSEAETEEDS